jgi:hypothetical protein
MLLTRIWKEFGSSFSLGTDHIFMVSVRHIAAAAADDDDETARTLFELWSTEGTCWNFESGRPKFHSVSSVSEALWHTHKSVCLFFISSLL